jgi:hypothetical protein
MRADPWIRDAATSAAARHATHWLPALAEATSLTPEWYEVITVVAEQCPRGDLPRKPMELDILLGG